MAGLGVLGSQDLTPSPAALSPMVPPMQPRLRTTDLPVLRHSTDWNGHWVNVGMSPGGVSHLAALPAVNNSAWRVFP